MLSGQLLMAAPIGALSTAALTIADETPDPGRGVFLVAVPEMPDPRFRQTVILIIEHSHQGGTHGLVINRPTELTIDGPFPEIDADVGGKHRVYLGGPVAPSSFAFLHRRATLAESSREVLAGVFIAADRQMLNELSSSASPGSLRTFFGYAGWAPGQLDLELATGSWQLVRADAPTVFSDEDPALLWRRLNRRRAGVLAQRPH